MKLEHIVNRDAHPPDARFTAPLAQLGGDDVFIAHGQMVSLVGDWGKEAYACKNSAAPKMGIPRKGCKTCKSLSPVTM